MGFFQPNIPQARAGTNLAGQVIAITGANAGIGFESSLQHLRLGASHLIMGVRNIQRGELARERMLADPEVLERNPKAQISVIELDLCSYKSVQDFAEQLKQKTNRLDALYLNAGLNSAGWKLTPDGHEELVQVHFLSNALLSFILWPLVSSTPVTAGHVPRITWTGSMAQNFNALGKMEPAPTSILGFLSDKKKYAAFNRYPDSKFLVAVFVRQFARAVPAVNADDSGKAAINNVCPGTVDTDIDTKHLPWFIKWIMAFHRMIRGRPVDQGSRTLLWAGELMGEETHGQYIQNNEITPITASATGPSGEAFSRQLWQETLGEMRRITTGRDQGILPRFSRPE